MTDKKLKDITSEKLVEIYGKVFNHEILAIIDEIKE